MVVETGEDVAHVEHVVGDVNAGYDQRDQVIDLGLAVLAALLLNLFAFTVFLIRNQTHLCGNCEVPHT